MLKSENIAPRILHECNHLIIVNKLAGELVQGDRTGDLTLGDLIKEYLRVKYNKPGEAFLGVIHRLDRPTTGAVMFAKTSKALSRMTTAFRERKVNKEYLAIANDRPPNEHGKLTHYLRKDEVRNRVTVYDKEVAGAKKAELEYHILASEKGLHLLSIELGTGRKHQIRAQLAAIGCPLVGDLKYGASRPLPNKSIALHSYGIEFDHPTRGERIQVMAPTPLIDPWSLFSGSLTT